MKYIKERNEFDEQAFLKEYRNGGLELKEFIDFKIKEEFSKLNNIINKVNNLSKDLFDKFKYVLSDYIWDELVLLVGEELENDPSLYDKYKTALEIWHRSSRMD